MRKTDISDYTEITEKPAVHHTGIAGSVVKTTFLLIWRTILTLLSVLFIACVIIGISMVMYVASIAREPTGIDLHSAKLNETSYIYIYDKNDNPQQYMQLYTSENRVTVDFRRSYFQSFNGRFPVRWFYFNSAVNQKYYQR